VENPRKVVLLALTNGWWFRPLYEQLHYGERVLCFQFIVENNGLSHGAFEAAVEKIFLERKPKNLSAIIALLTAANDIAQQLPTEQPQSASIHILSRDQRHE
jgi:hypothetical protein